ncbi:hypothetical protein phiCbK_275 [Caulobacter phage phiCbK]|uniref:Uncharacterized protein n=5 Tax=Viruses TaxID=10239 RepID=K4JPG8_9CAUD|nr:hypothetical protein D865_gp044 [Caulobacter phage phiCbK]AFO71791.1 hypothetical protein phiCbK_275 [Caulobacter phage phiCbK]AFU86876.1 hypothetical protein CbK_gp044 [Caulobacter phage phiCbK]ARB15294.1 hypothetical protein Ccr34_gp045 [Caulobacter phage Ccr34]
MPSRYDSLEDLMHDLDHEGIVDDGFGELDEEDLSLLTPPGKKTAPAPAAKKRGRPKKAT